MMTLSSHSKIKVAKNSPLTGKYLQYMFDFNAIEFRKPYRTFLENHFLMQTDTETLLAKEFEPLFLILHQPESSIFFKRMSDTRINEVCFAIKSDFVAQIVTNAQQTLNVVTYPLVMPVVGTWIQDELMAGFEFEENSIGAYETTLDLNELLVLSILLHFMKERVVAKGERLSADECFVEYEQIRGFKEFDQLSHMLAQLTGISVLESYLLNSDMIDNAITSLYQKGLLSTRDQFISLSGFGKRLFNPGKIKDSILVTERIPLNSQTTTINIMSDGYLLLKSENSTDDVVCHVQALPTDTPYETVFRIVCPNFFSNGFGDIEKYRKTIEKEALLFEERLKHYDTAFESNISEPVVEAASENPMISRFCTQCGTPITEASKFCIQCGNRLR